MPACASCGSENCAEAKFCATCGSALTRACPNGHPVPGGARFCDEVRRSRRRAEPRRDPPRSPAVVAERRLVSVLFADLVGYTCFSEGGTSRTSATCRRSTSTRRTVIGRYGGTIEKFIGDAVMAVWGAPVAREDDPSAPSAPRSNSLTPSPRSVPPLVSRPPATRGRADG